MFVHVTNENYGYSVATYGDYVAVGNPAILRYSYASGSVFRTGSIDYFLYNKSTDQHDLVGTLFFVPPPMDILLAAEVTGSILDDISTDIGNTGSQANKLIEIDKALYTASLENGAGLALDMYGTILVSGAPYYLQSVATSGSQFLASGSSVDIYDLSLTQLVTSVTEGDAFVYSLDNPDPSVTGSFGFAVSVNNSWIIVGSPYESGSVGSVFVYQNNSSGSNHYEWDLVQTLTPSGANVASPQFGWSVKLNKQSGSYSGSLVVGCGNPSAGQAFYFEYISGSWIQTFIFNDDTKTIYPLTFGNFTPYTASMTTASAFGAAVSLFQNTVVIGEYLDRTVNEFSGSETYQQGSVSIYDRCPGNKTNFALALKTYGTSSILKNNLLGYSVDIFGTNIVAGIPKINHLSMNSFYIAGNIQQAYECPDTLDNSVSGQILFLQQDTGSGEWEITNIYQRKKKFLSPYRDFGNSVAINGRSMVVGAPMLISDGIVDLTLDVTASSGLTLDDISGKAYIYNMANLSETFHVGNVFYRNGKIVVMTSGSAFDGLFFVPQNINNYQYDLTFQGEHTIFEKQVICSVNPGEFNVSTNPTAILTQTSSLDLNNNGTFDFQDLDVLMRYMQYKNTTFLGLTVSTDWSSSVVSTPDEISLLNYYYSLPSYNPAQTSVLASESIVRFETKDTWMQSVLDFNQDNRVDIRDMSILWKYFSHRLTQANFNAFITPACQRKVFTDVIDYLNFETQRTAVPQIPPQFLTYEQSVALDNTGSYLAPTTTTIGLYCGLDLVAIAKLGTPYKITPELPINFVVKMDF